MEESMARLYNEASQIISETIPEPWENVKLYAQIDEGSGEVLFLLPSN